MFSFIIFSRTSSNNIILVNKLGHNFLSRSKVGSKLIDHAQLKSSIFKNDPKVGGVLYSYNLEVE